MTGCMTEMGIENNWVTVEEIDEVVGCEAHRWGMQKQAYQLMVWHAAEEEWCVCAGGETVQMKKCREEGRSLAGNSCGGLERGNN